MLAAQYRNRLESLWMYDDGVVKGFVQVENKEIKKLFTEPILQSAGIGGALPDYAVSECGGEVLWVLEKKRCAIRFYERHGFCRTQQRKREKSTTKYLVCMKR